MQQFDGFRSSVNGALLLLVPVKRPTKHLPNFICAFYLFTSHCIHPYYCTAEEVGN